eukprot:m.56439 g.56439  ORF g.56439 m.56439 type:complete len:176 (-) comp22245_c0_seq2:777-1304(-)
MRSMRSEDRILSGVFSERLHLRKHLLRQFEFYCERHVHFSPSLSQPASTIAPRTTCQRQTTTTDTHRTATYTEQQPTTTIANTINNTQFSTATYPHGLQILDLITVLVAFVCVEFLPPQSHNFEMICMIARRILLFEFFEGLLHKAVVRRDGTWFFDCAHPTIASLTSTFTPPWS